MTRENKLALVVGFGLILLVGILISDHFSTASTQESAEFRGRGGDSLHRLGPDPTFVTTSPAITAAPPSNQEPIDLEPAVRESASAALSAPEPELPAIRRPRGTDRSAAVLPNEPIEMGAPIPGRVPQGLTPEPSETAPSMRTHHVAAGETLTSIVRRYYGSDELLQAFAAFNGIEDPNRLSMNRRLRIPDASVLRGERSASASPTPATASPSGGARAERAAAPPVRPQPQRTYTVRNGDVLSRIAARELGSSRHTSLLFEANRDILQSEDDIRAGMVLRLPEVPAE